MTSEYRNRGATAALGFAMALSSSQMAAQEYDYKTSGGWVDWDFYLGAGHASEYQGSDRYKAVPVLKLDEVWNDTVVLLDDDVGAFVLNHNGMGLPTTIGYGGGLKERDSDDLKVRGSIDNGAVFVHRRAVRFRRTDCRHRGRPKISGRLQRCSCSVGDTKSGPVWCFAWQPVAHRTWNWRYVRRTGL